MGDKLGKGLHTNEDGDRIFVDPYVDRYQREDGGEVIVVRSDESASQDADIGGSDSDD